MAFLRVDQGRNVGQSLELRGERIILGRHPSCQIVLDNAAVSRHHAQILESHGNFYVEDLRSRNHTYLNGDVLESRRQLRNADEIRVCDVVLSFHLQQPPKREAGAAAEGPLEKTRVDSRVGNRPTVSDEKLVEQLNEDANDSSSIIGTQSANASSSLLLAVRPEAKLRSIMEIGKALAGSLNLDEVLSRILDGLFAIFPQADNGFVLLRDPKTNKLLMRASKLRSTSDDDDVRISMTVVRKAMDSGDAILSADALTDKRFDLSESLSGLRIRSMMCVPLVGNKGEKLGVLQLDTKDLKQRFSQDDLDMLVSVASQASLAVENATLHEEILLQRDLERDLEFAMQVQLGFLPSQRPKVEGYEFHDYYEAALRVGGDYFDYISLPDGRLAFTIGDVAGKGVPAALLMARLYSSARYQLLTKPSAAAALTGLNADIASSGLGYRFVTSVFAILDPVHHTVSIANAGHMAPLLRDAKKKVKPVAQQQSGMPLGVVPTQEYGESVVDLKPGDTLLIYTDGVTEAMNPIREIYGRERLIKFLGKSPVSLDKMVNALVADVEEFCHEQAQRDDICLVALRRQE